MVERRRLYGFEMEGAAGAALMGMLRDLNRRNGGEAVYERLQLRLLKLYGLSFLEVTWLREGPGCSLRLGQLAKLVGRTFGPPFVLRSPWVERVVGGWVGYLAWPDQPEEVEFGGTLEWMIDEYP